MENPYVLRVKKVREALAQKGIDAFIISGTDPHASEYPAERWKQVRWISGFTGEAGDVVLTSDHAGLWTDTRFFIQANRELEGTGIELHKTRVPDEVLIPDYLAAKFHKSEVTVAFDGLCQSVGAVENLKRKLSKAYGPKGFSLIDIPDFLSRFWDNRPEIPSTAVTMVDEKIMGMTRAEKVEWLRGELRKKGCSCMLISALDEIAWLLNIRGEDIDYNPYVISYLIVTPDDVFWCVRDVDNVPVLPGITKTSYNTINDALYDIAARYGNIFIDPSTLNYNIYSEIEKDFDGKIVKSGTSPVILKKAIKNHKEIESFRKAFIEDGLAMEKYLYWLENKVKTGEKVTEWEASAKLTSLRAQIDGYHGNSFENISAYGENAALPHYCTPVKGSAVIEPSGLYLVDSGGHYDFGTTDITRTVPMGRCTKQEKEDYTVVLKGMIDLSMAVFPKGVSGCHIDAFARGPIWKSHRNFGHGTGHGIGFWLGVHEGPQSIRRNHLDQPILPGMVMSNEPGLYREGKHGIRHENVILCCEDGSNEFADWLKFETLTCCHIDTSSLKKKLLTKEELKWLNNYNRWVYKTLKGRLEPAIAQWLKKKCRKVRRCIFTS